MEYLDIHLSHVAQYVEYGFLGKMDWALIEVTAILEDGRLIPSSSVGNNKTWIEQAEKVIVEVNAWQPAELEGMHDVYYGLQPPPRRQPIPLVHPGQRIGSPYFHVPPEKIVGVVLTNSPDRNSAILWDYQQRSERLSFGKHSPHLMSECLDWHKRYLRSGRMRPSPESES